MCEEIACLITNRARLSPPDAVTSNVVMVDVQQSVMLYHNARFRGRLWLSYAPYATG